MPDQILHKRSLITGSIPTTSSLNVGEIALNVPDGKIYLHKSGSIGQSIESAITSNSTSQIGTLTMSGSLILSGSLDVNSGSIFDVSADNILFDFDYLSFSGSTEITGSLKVTQGITGSLFGTASYALQALSASFASTVPASGVIGLNLSQIATASFTASVSPTQFTVTSASITEFTVTGTGVTIGNAITDTHRVTGSLNISGSTNINGSAQLTGSMFITGSRITVRTTGTTDVLTITGSTGAYGNSVVTIDALGQTNQNGLAITNIGVGDHALELVRAGGAGSILFNNFGATPTLYAINKNLRFWTNNNAFDSSGISFLFTDNNKTSTHQKGFLIQGSTTTFKSGSYFEVQKSGSIPILHLSGDAQSGSFSPNELYISGSLRVNSGNSVITGSLTVVSNNARELQVTSAGVNIGNIITDTHTVTGSLNISGSVSATQIELGTAPMLITTAKVTQTNSGSFVVYSLPTASYDTAFFEYSIKSGSNARAGTIMAIQSGTSVNFTETTTTDFGNTTPVSFTVVVTGSNMALTGSSTTGLWTVKTIVRGI